MLDKAIEHGKEKRKPYYRSGKDDATCRPHGGCPWCKNNRLHSSKAKKITCEELEEEWEYEEELSSISR